MGTWRIPAARAALLLFAAFTVHNINARFIEPTYLGFQEIADYTSMEKLGNAIGSWPWLASGIGHIFSALAMLVLAFAVREIYREKVPVPAHLALGAGVISATGFLFGGLCDVAGSRFMGMLAEANPDLEMALLSGFTMVRGVANFVAIIALIWFALILSTCIRRAGVFGKGLYWFGLLLAAVGVVVTLTGIPIYLTFVWLWALWLSLAFYNQM